MSLCTICVGDESLFLSHSGQYYGLTLEFIRSEKFPKAPSSVKSFIYVSFREKRPLEEEVKAWNFWYSKQHSYKQRIIEIGEFTRNTPTQKFCGFGGCFCCCCCCCRVTDVPPGKREVLPRSPVDLLWESLSAFLI